MEERVQSKNYSLFAESLVNRYVGTISGKILDDVFVDRNPSEKILIGKLASNRVTQNFVNGYTENKQNQFTSIPSINVSLKVKKNVEGVIYFKPRGYLFYTITPDYQKTVEYILDEFRNKTGQPIDDIQKLSDICLEKIQIPYTYKKVDIASYMGDGIPIYLSSAEGEQFNLQNEISEKLETLEEKIYEEIKICKFPQVKLSQLCSEEQFRLVANPKECERVPNWVIDIYINVEDEGDSLLFTVQMVNNTSSENNEQNGYLPEIYDANIDIMGQNVEFLPLELDYFKSSFKERTLTYAISENTSVSYKKSLNTLSTNNVPKYYQYRLKTRHNLDSYSSFDALLLDPVSNLNYIAKEMDKDYEKCCKEIEFISSSAMSGFQKSLEEYRQEINRFKKGIATIECYDLVKKSFKQMIKTFMQKLPGEQRSIKGWRLFQIVFIVSLLPEVIRCEYPDDEMIREADEEIAELLYFPTGGGKTEAFLGVCVFSMFFDRYRGKADGVTAFLKYPLRLLAVQQLDRVLTIVTKANIIKNLDPEIKSMTDFAVGFYVGKNNTPNKIDKSERLSSRAEENNSQNPVIIESTESQLDEWYRFIDTCPNCGKKMVHVRFNQEEWKLEHICDNEECNTTVLPLYIVDNEIYRYLPSIIVSTVDKMSMVGISEDFKALMGQVNNRCMKHGFTPYKKCMCPGCESNVIPLKQPLKDPIPTLFIQDELHLIKESLGTFDAHYESFIHYYAKNLVPKEQRKTIRYIGATATISMYQNHINELYHMNGRRFPCEYPSKKSGEDFYSYTDKADVSRIILGFAPYGKSITEGMWLSVYHMRLAIYHFINNSSSEYQKLVEKGFEGTLEDYQKMLLNYWIELVYNNRKQDASELDNAFLNQGNNYLHAKNIPLFRTEMMTSDVDFQQVRKTLFEIHDNHENLNSTNLILATSTISHGVDEDSFNSMFFFGMPNNNAEYIQAYSRVGRKYTGIVVDIIRLMRIRDRSYLKNFIEFHENKDDLVETVPINRWARNAIYCTLPGILAAILYQYYTIEINEEHLSNVSILKKALQDGKINPDDVCEKIIAAYGCRPQEKLSEIYRDEIESDVKQILKGIKDDNLSNVKFTSEAIGKFSVWKKEPMRSLRDTDEQIELDLRRKA